MWTKCTSQSLRSVIGRHALIFSAFIIGTLLLASSNVAADYYWGCLPFNEEILLLRFMSFSTAATEGNAAAMAELGSFYVFGLGVEKDLALARHWFEQAVAKGNARAMVNLGRLYHKGRGVQMDIGKARLLYERAAGTW